MARQPTRRLSNGAVRRAAKRQRSSNSRGMHLSAVEIGTRQLLQRLWATDIASVNIALFQLCVSHFLRAHVPAPMFITAIDRIIRMLTLQAVMYLTQTQQWLRLDRS